MRIFKGCLVVGIFAGCAWILQSGQAAADETHYCTAMVDTLPYFITSPGHYCLTRDLSTDIPSGTAITIDADQVVLDLNKFALSGTAGPATQARGISILSPHHNVRITNGIVRGFLKGIEVFGAFDTSYVIDGITADGNYWYGIQVFSANTTIANCIVTNTGGSTQVGLTRGTAYGISMSAPGGSVAINNSVLRTFPSNGDMSIATGMQFPDGGTMVIGNRIVGDRSPGSIGLDLGSNPPGRGYRDNIVTGVQTAYLGGINLGNNTAY